VAEEVVLAVLAEEVEEQVPEEVVVMVVQVVLGEELLFFIQQLQFRIAQPSGLQGRMVPTEPMVLLELPLLLQEVVALLVLEVAVAPVALSG